MAHLHGVPVHGEARVELPVLVPEVAVLGVAAKLPETGGAEEGVRVAEAVLEDADVRAGTQEHERRRLLVLARDRVEGADGCGGGCGGDCLPPHEVHEGGERVRACALHRTHEGAHFVRLRSVVVVHEQDVLACTNASRPDTHTHTHRALRDPHTGPRDTVCRNLRVMFC
eukprot:1195898-Prorocentrum_minimum.AAC.4